MSVNEADKNKNYSEIVSELIKLKEKYKHRLPISDLIEIDLLISYFKEKIERIHKGTLV